MYLSTSGILARNFPFFEMERGVANNFSLLVSKNIENESKKEKVKVKTNMELEKISNLKMTFMPKEEDA